MKITITAIICIALLELVAIIKGLNGTVLAGAIAAIAGLGGYSIARKRYKQ